MATRWKIKPFDADRASALARQAGVSSLVAQLLLNRGITDAARASAFIQAKLTHLHDPGCLPGVIEAADRLVRAVRDGRRIVIYGDYDVDGVCGTSILWACLKLAGAKDVRYYIPHRVEEGYGVNASALRHIAGSMRAEVVVTVDCGITAVAEARLARELGLELIITDHHTPGDVLPEAAAVVHPRVGGTAYPCPELCGAGVAFKLAWQICKGFGDGKKASPHLRDFLVRSIGLVALATVADVVPLTGENRVLVRHGLGGIDASPTVGLRALMDVAKCQGKRKLNTGTVGFNLAPRINAAGRMERAMQAVEMLTTDDAEAARTIAADLDRCNSRRQEIEKTIVGEAQAIYRSAGEVESRGAVVVARQGWHPGVIGIVASRMVEIYHRPAVVIALTDDLGQGSARSVPSFDLYQALKSCSDGLSGFGGHAAAAGLRLPAALLPAFAERFDHHCRAHLTADQKERSLVVDAEVLLGWLSVPLVEEIESLEPYGIGNPKPVFVASRVRVVGDAKVVGARQNHVQLRFAQGEVTCKAIAWNLVERCKPLVAGAVCSIAFTPSINEWNGRREVQLEIKDFRLEAEPAPEPFEESPAVS